MDQQVQDATATGFNSAEARRRLDEFGPNVVAEEALPSWRIFFAKFWGPIPWMLEIAVFLQFVLGEYVEAAVVGHSCSMRRWDSFKKAGQARPLQHSKNRLAPTALVRRDGEWVRLPASELVPGDVIRLALGVVVPADAAIVSGSVLVDQDAHRRVGPGPILLRR